MRKTIRSNLDAGRERKLRNLASPNFRHYGASLTSLAGKEKLLV
jgi:hypothetical protein